MRQLSVKIGLLFLVFILLIQAVLFFALYWTIAGDRVDEVFEGMLAQGRSHAEALATDFSGNTMAHVVMMEQGNQEDVAIISEDGDIVQQGADFPEEIKGDDWLDRLPETGPDSVMLEENWQGASHVVSASRVTIEGAVAGYVVMAAPSELILGTVSQLTNQFIIGGMLSVVLTVATVFFLSRVVSLPLRQMTEATRDLAKGEMHVTLGYDRHDELGELELAIRKLAQDLEKMKQERNEFLAGIAHELKTPLTYLKGYADMAKRADTSEADRARYLAIIEEEAASLTRLVGDLFDLAKLDSNSFVIEKERVDLSDVVRGFCRDLAPAAEERNRQLVEDIEDGLWVRADERSLIQVLRNLTDNAIRYSDEGGTVTVSLKRDRDGRMLLTVADDGAGIAKHHLPYLFDRLYRADPSRSRETGGSGIGLSIVKAIVDQHGWTIEAKSDINKGTVMTVTIPKGEVLHGDNPDRG